MRSSFRFCRNETLQDYSLAAPKPLPGAIQPRSNNSAIQGLVQNGSLSNDLLNLLIPFIHFRRSFRGSRVWNLEVFLEIQL